MWGLALVNQNQGILHFARDRFGEKPLYWLLSGTGTSRALFYASEFSALRAYCRFSKSIDRAALAQLLRFRVMPAQLSIFCRDRQTPCGGLVFHSTALLTLCSVPDQLALLAGHFSD